ncbi:uncharacterized protein LOC130331011 [Hyla sarda]|uniref:uncharacterized protein LOC130305507 n=1 Tax=Hyla sarda TaxID=327740 RepID=UPI0024C2EBBA|nr:uncharacterized protein LOC130305507 [Hyla sarda]XP_056409646.1 uncharacterized protein LOC130331011 [Hyla sarda]
MAREQPPPSTPASSPPTTRQRAATNSTAAQKTHLPTGAHRAAAAPNLLLTSEETARPPPPHALSTARTGAQRPTETLRDGDCLMIPSVRESVRDRQRLSGEASDPSVFPMEVSAEGDTAEPSHRPLTPLTPPAQKPHVDHSPAPSTPSMFGSQRGPPSPTSQLYPPEEGLMQGLRYLPEPLVGPCAAARESCTRPPTHLSPYPASHTDYANGDLTPKYGRKEIHDPRGLMLP